MLCVLTIANSPFVDVGVDIVKNTINTLTSTPTACHIGSRMNLKNLYIVSNLLREIAKPRKGVAQEMNNSTVMPKLFGLLQRSCIAVAKQKRRSLLRLFSLAGHQLSAPPV